MQKTGYIVHMSFYERYNPNALNSRKVFEILTAKFLKYGAFLLEPNDIQECPKKVIKNQE